MNTFEGWAVMMDGHISLHSIAGIRRAAIAKFLQMTGKSGPSAWRRMTRRGWRCRRIVITDGVQ